MCRMIAFSSNEPRDIAPSLASALEKLEAANRRRPLRFGSPASQGLFIVNPFSGGGLVRIFSSHPPIQERVARLRALARGVDQY